MHFYFVKSESGQEESRESKMAKMGDRMAYSAGQSGPETELTRLVEKLFTEAKGKFSYLEILNATAATRPELVFLDDGWRAALQTGDFGVLPEWLQSRCQEVYSAMVAEPGETVESFEGYDWDEALSQYRDELVEQFGMLPSEAAHRAQAELSEMASIFPSHGAPISVVKGPGAAGPVGKSSKGYQSAESLRMSRGPRIPTMMPSVSTGPGAQYYPASTKAPDVSATGAKFEREGAAAQAAAVAGGRTLQLASLNDQIDYHVKSAITNGEDIHSDEVAEQIRLAVAAARPDLMSAIGELDFHASITGAISFWRKFIK